MVPCQQSIMLDTAKAFEQLVRSPKVDSKEKGGKIVVTWDTPNEVETYIKKLQTVTEKLTSDNRRLRKCHTMMTDKVAQLIGIDLLRHQPKWKDILVEMRQIITNLNQQVFY